MLLDTYGFERNNEIPSDEQFRYECYYNNIQQERLIKWERLIKKNDGQIPQKSDKIKRYVRKGIPRSLRAECWFQYSGAKSLMHENDGLYDILMFREAQDVARGYTTKTNEIFKTISIIETDLLRTFPNNIKFRVSNSQKFHYSSHALINDEKYPYIQSLRRILVAFAYYSTTHPDQTRKLPRSCTYQIGYCQSLNYLVGLLLLIYAEGKAFETDEMERVEIERMCFWTLVAIVEQLMPVEMYGSTLEGARLSQEVLWKWIFGKKGKNFGLGKIQKWLETTQRDYDSRIKTNNPSSMPPMDLITTNWFMTVFVGVLPIESALRVWDCFLYQGEKVLIRIALTMIKMIEDEILSFDEPIQAWKFVKDSPKKMFDSQRLMNACFKPRRPMLPLPLNIPSINSATTQSSPRDSLNSPNSLVSPRFLPREMELRYDSGSVISEDEVSFWPVKYTRTLSKGVGSVSYKMIERFRDLAIEDRKVMKQTEEPTSYF